MLQVDDFNPNNLLSKDQSEDFAFLEPCEPDKFSPVL